MVGCEFRHSLLLLCVCSAVADHGLVVHIECHLTVVWCFDCLGMVGRTAWPLAVAGLGLGFCGRGLARGRHAWRFVVFGTSQWLGSAGLFIDDHLLRLGHGVFTALFAIGACTDHGNRQFARRLRGAGHTRYLVLAATMA